MTALAYNGRSLTFRGKPDFRLGRGTRRGILGPLERARLKTVLAQAEQVGIKGTIPEILCDLRLVGLLSRQFKVPVPSVDACRRYYRDHIERFREADRYLGRQIVLRSAKNDAAAYAEAWARAERLIAILFYDPNMFGDLAATYDSIGDRTGTSRVGPVVRDALPPELDIALFGLRPGQIYPAPIASEEGVHVMLLDRILPGEVLPFAAVHGQISATLRRELRIAAARRHLVRLAERYRLAAAE